MSYPNLGHCSFLGILYCSTFKANPLNAYQFPLDPFTCIRMHLALIPQRLENQSQCPAFTAMAETAAASCGYGEGPAPLSLPIPSRKAPEARCTPSPSALAILTSPQQHNSSVQWYLMMHNLQAEDLQKSQSNLEQLMEEAALQSQPLVYRNR